MAASPELTAIPTPFLAVDLDALERNLERMSSFFRSRASFLRPHVKHHKCSALAALQVEAGARGLTCATAAEAFAIAHAGLDDLLVANVVADRVALDALVGLERRVTVAVDSDESVALAAAAAQQAGSTLGVVVDLDIGMGRTGVASADEAAALAERVRRTPALELRGVMGYEGHLVSLEDRTERRTRAEEAYAPLLEAAAQVGGPIVTGGSTSTYEPAADALTDVQAGTYLLMDATYERFTPEFEPALVLVATVASSRADGRLVADAGSKRLATDWGPPALVGLAAEHVSTAEEHVTFRCAESPPRAGARVAILPGHTCTTVSLHQRLHALRGGRLERVLDVDARDPLA